MIINIINKILLLKYSILLYLPFLLSTLLILTKLWFNRKFGNISLESVIFTFRTTSGSFPKSLIYSYSKRLILSFLIAFMLTLALKYICKKIKQPILRKFCYFIVPLLYIFSSTFFVTILHFDRIKRYIFVEYSTFFDEHYDIKPNYFLKNDSEKKNCIILILESMENTFSDREIGLPLTMKLKKISDENLSFPNLRQLDGTCFTTGAMTGQLFGIPLNIPINADKNYLSTKFLPNAISVLDILDKNNYNINFIIGSTAEFGVRDSLFKTHSKNPTIYDQNYFLQFNQNNKFNDENGWGFNDKFIYDNSKNIITKLSNQSTPFFTVILTVDTHSPGKVLNYTEPVYHDARDAFIEADNLAFDFITWFKEQNFYNDTILIILGDHQFMSNKIGNFKIPKDYKRTIYNTFINVNKDMFKIQNSHLYSTVDIAPTILELIGFELSNRKFGLGVSLLSDQPTLIDVYGEQYVNKELRKKSKLYDSFF
jgi:phosphoglycerol transferase